MCVLLPGPAWAVPPCYRARLARPSNTLSTFYGLFWEARAAKCALLPVCLLRQGRLPGLRVGPHKLAGRASAQNLHQPVLVHRAPAHVARPVFVGGHYPPLTHVQVVAAAWALQVLRGGVVVYHRRSAVQVNPLRAQTLR